MSFKLHHSEYFLCNLPYATILIILLKSSKNRKLLKNHNTNPYLYVFVLTLVCVSGVPVFVTFFSVLSINHETLFSFTNDVFR